MAARTKRQGSSPGPAASPAVNASPKDCDTASHAPEGEAAATLNDPTTGKFTKGHSKRGGRAKGVPNTLNADAKQLMDALVQHGLEEAQRLFDASARKSPTRALAVLARFAEFRLPKLARTEVTGPDGGPQVIEKRVYVRAATQSEADAVAASLASTQHKE